MNSKSDIWQIGVLLYELTTGKLPFYNDSLLTIKRNIVHKKYRSVDETRPDTLKILDMTLRDDPSQRANVDDLITLLKSKKLARVNTTQRRQLSGQKQQKSLDESEAPASDSEDEFIGKRDALLKDSDPDSSMHSHRKFAKAALDDEKDFSRLQNLIGADDPEPEHELIE